MSNLNRSQILDALRREKEETVAMCAQRFKATSRTLSNWLNHPEKIGDKIWLRILQSYNVSLADAEVIAAKHPVLKASILTVEMAKRAAEELVASNIGRDPTSRKVGEKKWWVDPNFYEKGTKDPLPSFNENQKVFNAGHSHILTCIDALTNQGITTTKEAILSSYAQNRITRTAETAVHIFKGLEDQAAIYFELLLTNGDILPGEDGSYVLAEHVYDSQIQQPTGDPRQMSVALPASQLLVVYLPFEYRMPILEDTWGKTLPKIHQRKGVPMTEEDIEELYSRTKIPRVEVPIGDDKEVADTDLI